MTTLPRMLRQATWAEGHVFIYENIKKLYKKISEYFLHTQSECVICRTWLKFFMIYYHKIF